MAVSQRSLRGQGNERSSKVASHRIAGTPEGIHRDLPLASTASTFSTGTTHYLFQSQGVTSLAIATRLTHHCRLDNQEAQDSPGTQFLLQSPSLVLSLEGSATPPVVPATRGQLIVSTHTLRPIERNVRRQIALAIRGWNCMGVTRNCVAMTWPRVSMARNCVAVAWASVRVRT